MKNKTTTRPPIVVVLGHIDHGKTSLLLAIRNQQFTGSKPGGEITQHLGAYQVEKDNKKITFLDTPGHEAFSQMRSRGAKVADIAILVIDATQGVQTQTKEVIKDIKETGIQLIVALNKIDRVEADPERVKRELEKEGLVVESLGGKIPSLEVSAKTQKGISDLLDMILLIAEMEELEANPNQPGEGLVIESYLDSSRGATATLLLSNGSFQVGDTIGTNSAFTKIKSIENFQKDLIKKAFPSDPVIVFGFNQVAKVGEKFQVFNSLKEAEEYVKESQKKEIEKEVLTSDSQEKSLNLVLKTDVLGSLEAIEEILKTLPQDKVSFKILKSEVGSVNESDIKLAQNFNASIFAFRTKIDSVAKKLLERQEHQKQKKIKVLTFNIIYDLVEGVRRAMERIIEPEKVKEELGKLKVLARFLAEKNRQIVGGRVTEGKVEKKALIEVYRKEEKVGQGRMINLQRNKKDIDLVQKGDECGILFEGNVLIEEGDVLVFYIEKLEKGEL